MEQCYKIEWLVEYETKTSIGETTIVERHWIGHVYPCYNSIYDLAEVAWHVPNLRGHNFWMTCGSILLLLSLCLMLIYCVKINRSEINNHNNDRNTQCNAAPVIISRWADDLPVAPRQPTLAELKEQADKLLAEFRSAQKQFSNKTVTDPL
ncbi:unnamed protein product [Adineta steineri]|uniref:Uncharacterized protein n=1 Tax=Adineta steineri TaxID=433720 RepID=A0A819RDA5_9BILA|nr:unnamed protein product [Adineta steineri]